MGFLKSAYASIARAAKMGKLKDAFEKECPGESMIGTLEGYCGTGMMVAQSLNDGTLDRLRFIEAFELGLAQEKEHHRAFASRAYDIGVDSMIKVT
ncbi:hypothetical protein [Collimonas fungivorans]|uniref:hypothetical protein n=1 Tax=Collimonas fungivorans TaxID=158899 RepID=UPI0007787A9F|nr:hypothetical protein [Collimonas fungivorans]